MEQVRFSDGGSYDLMMGPWSRSVGELFLSWLQPADGLEWLDVGCGSGAFTSLIVERCAPTAVLGVDPSDAQLDYARQRGLGPTARFEVGAARALPVSDRSVDVAIAALVLHFMPDPQAGVTEMARVTRPGGVVGAYAWNLLDGGFPYDTLYARMGSSGYPPPEPPSPAAAGAREMERIWTNAGLTGIETRVLSVTRTFKDFSDYWRTAITSPRIAAVLSQVPAEALEALKADVEKSLPYDEDGSVVPVGTANAILGRVPSVREWSR